MNDTKTPVQAFSNTEDVTETTAKSDESAFAGVNADLLKGAVLKTAWLYDDIMDLYGDTGNMLTLKKRCQERGIEFVLDRVRIGDFRDLSQYDLIFMGGGADKEQASLIDDLLARKDNLAKAIEEKSFVLLICGGYQLFGQYYEAADKSKIPGLGFFDYYTETGKEGSRCIGNIVIDASLDGNTIRLVGFENHGGQTRNVKQPLGKVLHGYGNSFDAGFEGMYSGQVLGTYLHGPLLPKNGQLADFVIYKALKKRLPQLQFADLPPLEAPFEKQARAVLFDRFQIHE